MTLPNGRPAQELAGARIGRVTGLTPDGPLVEVPSMATGYAYGPARVTERLSALPTSSTGTVGLVTHTHTAGRPLAIGDEVLVLFLGASRTDLVVVDRLLPPA